MKLLGKISFLLLSGFLIGGCAGAYAPEVITEETQRSYSSAQEALLRAQKKEAPQRAEEEYKQAEELFSEARASLEKLPTEETSRQFRDAQTKADLASIKAQETTIADQHSEIASLDQQLVEREKTIEKLGNKISNRDAKLASLQDTKTRLRNALAVTKDRSDAQEASYNALQDTLTRRESQFARLEDTVTEQNKALETRQDTIAELETEISELRKKILELETRPVEKIAADKGWSWKKLRAEEIQAVVQDDLISDTVFYRLDINIDFAIGEFRITPRHRRQLQKMENLKHLSDHQLIAVGSTDELAVRGNEFFDSNRELSLLRALKTIEALMEYHDFPENKVAMMGVGEYGEFKPEFENLDFSERRRVEFWLIPLRFLEEMPGI